MSDYERGKRDGMERAAKICDKWAGSFGCSKEGLESADTLRGAATAIRDNMPAQPPAPEPQGVRLSDEAGLLVSAVRDFEKHSDVSGDPVGGCGECLKLFDRLIAQANVVERVLAASPATVAGAAAWTYEQVVDYDAVMHRIIDAFDKDQKGLDLWGRPDADTTQARLTTLLTGLRGLREQWENYITKMREGSINFVHQSTKDAVQDHIEMAQRFIAALDTLVRTVEGR